MLTCDGAFDIYGLDFESDSVTWGVLMNGYLEMDRSLCRPVMGMEAFIHFISKLKMVSGVSPETEHMSKIFCLGHYVAAHYSKYHGKRNTLVGYMRQLCKMANSVFCQLVVLRYMGECHRNDNLRIVFDTLVNPVDDDGHVATAYINDDLYDIYRERLDFVSRVLCGCSECCDGTPVEIIGRVHPWMCRKIRMGVLRATGRHMLGGSFAHLRGSDSFFPMYPPNIRHLNPLHISLIISELSKDVMQQYIYGTIDAGQLPLKLNMECIGKGFLEKAVLVLVYNVTFTMFLISCTRRLIHHELTLCKKTFIECVSGLVSSCDSGFVIEGYTDMIARGGFSIDSLPGVLRAFMTNFRGTQPFPLSVGCNRAKVILEHICLLSPVNPSRTRYEISLAQQMRHTILSEYEVIDFDEITSDPDISTVTNTVLYSVSGMFIFRAPLWFTSCSGSGAISEMISSSARRRKIMSASRIRAERKRIAGRMVRCVD